jgi:membrane-associated phospholipid phosphatase
MSQLPFPGLGDPRARLGLGLVGLVLTRLAVRPDRVGPVEARVFREINDLPDAPAPLVWLSMQPGALGAVPVAAAAAHLSGRRALAYRLLMSGFFTWALSKVIKSCTARPRPEVLLAGTRRRGAQQSGLGFVSGHAGVATSLCLAALAELSPPGRTAAVMTSIGVALGRLYTGAHLPLDIAGGAALGVAVEAAVEIQDRRGRMAPTRSRIDTMPTTSPSSYTGR